MRIAITSTACLLQVALPLAQSFSVSSSHIHRQPSNSSLVKLSATSTAAAAAAAPSTATAKDIKTQLQKEFEGTNRGLTVTAEQNTQIDDLVTRLEAECPLTEPARSPLMGGRWIVDYTTAPPPSNGKLGPFAGIARQVIDLDGGTYENYLSVPGDIEKEWLSASLVATFEEWDGVFLEDNGDGKWKSNVSENNDDDQSEAAAAAAAATTAVEVDDSSKEENWLDAIASMFKGGGSTEGKSAMNATPDYGKQCWKVDFQTLTIKAFGVTLINKKFEGTSRVWKTSYLDQDGTKVVRAGRTGKDEDSLLFYMTREE